MCCRNNQHSDCEDVTKTTNIIPQFLLFEKAISWVDWAYRCIPKKQFRDNLFGSTSAFSFLQTIQGAPLAYEGEGSSSKVNSKWDKLNPETPAAEPGNCLGGG